MPRLYRCLRPALVRAGFGLDTEPVGELAVGTEIIALSSTVLPSAVERVQFDAGDPAGWVSRTVSGRGRLARSIPILQDLGELDVLLAGGCSDGAAPPAPLSLREKMTLSLLTSGEVAPAVVRNTAEAAAKAEIERLAAEGVEGADEALAELAAHSQRVEEPEVGTTVYMSVDEHQAACAQQRAAGSGVGDGDGDWGYEVSDESEDPFGGFDSSDEEHSEGNAGRSSSCRHSMHHQRASSGRQSMRMSTAFTPSKPGGSLLTSDDHESHEPTPHDSQAGHDGAEEVYESSDDEVRAPASRLATASPL